MRPTFPSTVLVAITTATLLLGAVGCGSEPRTSIASAGGEAGSPEPDDGSDGATGGGSKDGAGVDDHAATLEFVECMREEGIDMPDPDPDGRLRLDEGRMAELRRNGEPSPELQKAFEACREFSPFGSENPADDPELRAALRDFAACVREFGIDMPDPEPGGLPGFDQELRDHPRFEEAMEECGDLLQAVRR